jgi:hypothetical protein
LGIRDWGLTKEKIKEKREKRMIAVSKQSFYMDD